MVRLWYNINRANDLRSNKFNVNIAIAMADVKAIYPDRFDSLAYVKYYASEGCEFGLHVENFYHRIFTEGKVSGNNLLDVGCGPTVRATISASAFVPEIYLSDLLEGNRNVVEKWLRNDPDAVDFSFQFKHIAGLEGIRYYKDLEKRARNAVKGVLPIDILADNPLYPREHRQYDVVTSSYCLCCYPDDKVYFEAMKNLSSLIRPGGYLAFVSTYMCTTYDIDKAKPPLPSNPVDEAKLRRAMNEANLDVLEITFENINENIVQNCDNKGHLLALAIKRK